MTGIVSYGFYVPKFRITVEEIAKSWHKDPVQIKSSLQVAEKSVANMDEDSLTMGFSSGLDCLSTADINKKQIKSSFFGTETPAYAVKPTSTILADFLDIGNNYLAFDTQFACKAATGAWIASLGMAKSDPDYLGLVCASDKANSKPGDSLEYTAGSGSVTLLVGNQDVAVEVIDSFSYSSDNPDFWRKNGILWPSHAGRFTGKPSYFYHIQRASEYLLDKHKLKPSDFDFAVFHMPNGKFPRQIAKHLGFSADQLKPSLVVEKLGNSYTASSLMGLVATLEKAKAGDLIFMCSYGSGAGADAFVLRVTENINRIRKEFSAKIEKKSYIDYLTYRKFMNSL